MLAYIPLPNLDTTTQNFHYVTNDDSNTDAISLRLIHNFGDSSGLSVEVVAVAAEVVAEAAAAVVARKTTSTSASTIRATIPLS